MMGLSVAAGIKLRKVKPGDKGCERSGMTMRQQDCQRAMSLFNRLKVFIKFWMINLGGKLKIETFELFVMLSEVKESA
ncbi:hypothetical protein [Roseibium sediminicola]|uniref:hypothetical protein n=1 Tax=Roseibium sediminicola TaxID=2933272 RepID=UPI0020040ABD|nr:hypothetical protein [Roseibium sp. CAU 1639]